MYLGGLFYLFVYVELFRTRLKRSGLHLFPCTINCQSRGEPSILVSQYPQDTSRDDPGGKAAPAQAAHPLTAEESGEAMVRYARRYPTAARDICHKVGYRVDGSEEDYRSVGRETIPFIALRQRDKVKSLHW